jgi:hypothetical protein
MKEPERFSLSHCNERSPARPGIAQEPAFLRRTQADFQTASAFVFNPETHAVPCAVHVGDTALHDPGFYRRPVDLRQSAAECLPQPAISFHRHVFQL